MDIPKPTGQPDPKTGCVIVLYHPQLDNLSETIKRWKNQVNELILVDNTPGGTDCDFSKFGVEYIPLRTNTGIAAAQNRGIKAALEKKCDYVIFSDQDSIPSETVVAKLMAAGRQLDDMGIKTGVLGVRARNTFTGELYGYTSKIIGEPGQGIPGKSNFTEVYSVMSSGSMIPMSALIENGGFDEGLFIDGVDHEWCWRGWHKHQLRSFIVEDALISHSKGEGDRKLLGRTVGISSTNRLYYQYRNFLWLRGRATTPGYWKKKNLIKYLIKMFYFPIMVSPRKENLINIFKGIKEGLHPTSKEPQYPTFKE